MGWIVGRVGCALLVLVVAGCYWPVPGHDAERSGSTPTETAITAANVDQLELEWSVDPVATDGTSFLTLGDPIVSAHGVHVTGISGSSMEVVTLRARDGQAVWTRRAIAGNGDFVEATDPWIVGDELVTGGFLTEVVGDDRDAFVYSFLYDAASGSPEEPIGLGPVEAARGNLVLTNGFGTSAVGDVTHPGTTTWSAPDDATSFVLGSSRIYSATRELVRATPAAGGAPIWQTPLPVGDPQPLVLGPHESTVFVATAAGGTAGRVHALDARTGAIRWTANLDHAPSAAPALADGVLYVPSFDGLTALDAATGATLWTTTAWAGHQPVVAGGLVLVPGDFMGSPALAYDAHGCGAAECEPVWSSTFPATALTISGGHLYTTWSPSVAPFVASVASYGLPD